MNSSKSSGENYVIYCFLLIVDDYQVYFLFSVFSAMQTMPRLTLYFDQVCHRTVEMETV